MAQATESQIAMWRGAIALIWVNTTLDEGEKKKLLEYFRDNVYLTDAQRAQLIQDMDHRIELKDVWDDITDVQDRAHLIDIAPTLFSKHGAPTPEERALYDKMLADQMALVDTQEFHEEIAKIKAHIPVEMAQVDAEYKKDFGNLGIAGRIMYHFDTMLDGIL